LVNKPGSIGYVTFTVNPVPSVSNGTMINNNASIYFDYNAPVLTNTASTLIQDPNSVVPVKLISFSAYSQPNSSNALLNWSTTNEINIKSFVVEQSLDGVNFTDIGTVAAKDQYSNNYSFNINANANVIYYRLKI